MTTISYQTVRIDEEGPIEQTTEKPGKKALASLMLTTCIIAFVIQTELAQYVQKSTNFSKPYFMLFISHSFYTLMFPLQLLQQYIQLENKRSFIQDIKTVVENNRRSIEVSTRELQKKTNTDNQSPVSFIVKTSLTLSVLLTLPSYIWYTSVNLTTMANLTAIYNTSCFFAYFFSIVMLHDRIIGSKVTAIVLCILGVLFMAYWPNTDHANIQSTKSWIGIVVASLGASLLGFYEVYYKKYITPPEPTIYFANMVTAFIGLTTIFVFWIPIPLLHWTGIETFVWPDTTTLFYILVTASMSFIYNATFMAVIALVHPVFAAVGVMLTIPAVAIADVLITGVSLPLSTIIGSLFILIGFIILNRSV